MVFSSVTFLTVFLPVTAVLYFIPNIFTLGKNSSVVIKYKNLILLAVSLMFYAWGEPRNIILMLLSIVFNFTVALHLDKYEKGKIQRRLLLCLSLFFNLGLLVFFKYSSFIAENIASVLGFENSYVSPVLPIGISFYTFQILSYVIDVYKEKSKVQKSLADFALYISMFPQLIAGPIVQYGQIEKELKSRTESFSKVSEGLFQFIIGLFKKTVLANSCGAVFEEIIADGTGKLSLVSSWIAIIFYAFQIYFDFGGYSDMAIGLGNIFGFTFPQNFNHPYIATSVTDFWRRWHITLSSWFRDYVYIPLGGNRCSVMRNIFNLFVVWSLTGLWHGASWNFILWGIYYFFLLILEKYVLNRVIEIIPTIIRRIVTFIFVLFGWVLFSFTSLSDIYRFTLSLFGRNGIYSSSDLYMLYSNAAMLIIAGVISTGAFTFRRDGEKTAVKLCRYIISFALLAVSVIYLIGDTYNPFLYFRF